MARSGDTSGEQNKCVIKVSCKIWKLKPTFRVISVRLILAFKTVLFFCLLVPINMFLYFTLNFSGLMFRWNQGKSGFIPDYQWKAAPPVEICTWNLLAVRYQCWMSSKKPSHCSFFSYRHVKFSLYMRNNIMTITKTVNFLRNTPTAYLLSHLSRLREL